MQKKTYLLLLVLFFGTAAFVVLRHNGRLKNKVNAFYPLQERNGVLAASPEWASVKDNANRLIRIVRDDPDDLKSALALASLYIQEARVTGNYNYYDAAAMNYTDAVLEKEPGNFDALTLKAILQLSQHHFTDALETAAKAKKINPYNAFVEGIMVDGSVEMGQYKEAVEHSDAMVSIRPDIRSYSRISYLREIHGDLPGAIEAMKMAVDAGGYGDEPTAWARIQLARLYGHAGATKDAEMHYTIALQERPGYAYALAGLGNLAMAGKNYGKAIDLYRQASEAMNDPAFGEQLAVLYRLTNQKKKADETIETLIENLSKAASKEEGSINHHTGKELAYAYLLAKDHGKALQYTLDEYNRRPDNIDVNETVAWVYYQKGDASKALPFIQAALVTGSKNPTLLCRAGTIYAKAGAREKAKTLLQEALQNSPVMDAELKDQSTSLLKSL